MLNARVLAELLELEFRFVWPLADDPSVRDPAELFADPFREEFELEPDELDGLRCVTYHQLVSMPPTSRAAVLSDRARSFIEMNELFGVVRAGGESHETACRRYRRCFTEFDWNDVTRGVIDFAADSATLDGLAGVHVRAGDIVTGPWRHTVSHQKYQPTPFVHQALTGFTAHGTSALVLSDNDEYVAFLRSWFPAVVTAQELVPGYERLTETQRALADIVVLSRCNPIVGPPASAFSKLAANLGDAVPARTDTFVRAGEERELLLSGVAGGTGLAKQSELWAKLTALDICWLLDVFGDTMPLAEQHELAIRAARLDPESCAALSHLGRVAALVGDRRTALRATSRALEFAEHVDRHDDPLFEALASSIIAQSLTGLGRKVASRSQTMRRQYARLSELDPFWFELPKILPGLLFLIDVAESVSAQNVFERRRAKNVLRETFREPPETVGWRTDGLAQHRKRLLYDPLARDLDRITRYVERALRVLQIDVDRPAADVRDPRSE